MYPIYYDLMAKFLFGTFDNKKFLIKILELIFDLESNSLKDLVILNSVRLSKESINSKDFDMDILVLLPNEVFLNIEFYSNYDRSSEIKSIMYISRFFSSNLKRGDNYIDVKPHLQINFIKNNKLHKSSNLINKYILINTEDDTDEMIPDVLKIYTINLDYPKSIDYNMSELERWITFIGTEDDYIREEIVKGDKLMEEALKKAKEFCNEEYTKGYFWSKSLAKSQFAEEKEEALEQAQKEKEQALEEKVINIAKNLMKDNLDIETISKCTGLSIDQIKNLPN